MSSGAKVTAPVAELSRLQRQSWDPGDVAVAESGSSPLLQLQIKRHCVTTQHQRVQG